MDTQKATFSKFNNGLRWNVIGSISYEVIKTIHHLFLLKFLNIPFYGMIGSALGLIYLTTKIADVGTTFSLPPFFHLFKRSQHNFKTLLFKHFLLPQLPVVLLASWAMTYFYRHKLSVHPSLLWVFASIIILETLRSFLRYFLNFSFKARTVVALELTTFFFYVSIIWFSVLALNARITFNLIFIPHLVETTLVVAIFSAMVYRIYKRIPVRESTLAPDTWRRIVNVRLFNYLLRLSKELFTRNFLTPLFAFKFGFQQAGFFFFAGTIATSIQSIIKYSIGYSGNALFANIKESSQAVKKEAFDLLCKKLTTIVAPIIIFLLFNYRLVARIGTTQNPTLVTAALFLMFLIVILTEFFLLLYEQFYIIEEASKKLFFFKALELLLLYVVVSSKGANTPLIMLTNIVIIRLLSFVIIAINAYFVWRIWPRLNAKASYLVGCALGALLFSVIFQGGFDENI